MCFLLKHKYGECQKIQCVNMILDVQETFLSRKKNQCLNMYNLRMHEIPAMKMEKEQKEEKKKGVIE